MLTMADLLALTKQFIADVGQPQRFRIDSAGENTSRRFVTFYDENYIRREYTVPHTRQKNAPVESLLWRVLNRVYPSLQDMPRVFPSLDFKAMEHLTTRG